MPSETQRILFLTTQEPTTIKAEWPFYQKWTLLQCLRDRGGDVYMRNWRDTCLDVDTLASFDKISFLWCNTYHEHPIQFIDFLKTKLTPAQQGSPGLIASNDTKVILWNTDKAVYLPAIEQVGFTIPKTAFIRDLSSYGNPADLADAIASLSTSGIGTPVVLKPSISGSSKGTYLIRDPMNPIDNDNLFLSGLLSNGVDGFLIIQAFEPAIANGEYSLVFIAGKHTHTMIKKPAKGEFKCQAEFGGSISELPIDQVPQQAQVIAAQVMKYMEDNVGPVPYCRVDGVLRDSGEFVLMEIEAIEPHLWLETCNDQSIREMLYDHMLQ